MSNATLSAPTSEPDGSRTTALDAYAHLIGSLRRIKRKQAQLSKERKEHEATIRAALAANGADVGAVGGVPVVSVSTTLRVSLSQKLLKERHPEIAKECSDITEVNVFRLLD